MTKEERERAKKIVGKTISEWLHENQEAQKKAASEEIQKLRDELTEVRSHTTKRMDQLMAGGGSEHRESTPQKRIADFIRAAHYGKDDHERAHRFAEQRGFDPIVVKALSSNIGTEGAYTVGENLATDIIELRRAASAVMQAGPTILPLDGGNLSIPRIDGGSTSSFVGENTASNASQQTIGQVKLVAKKQVTKVPASNELLRRSAVSADAMIAAEITEGAAQRRDQAYLRDNGTADTPVGFRWAAAAAQITGSNAANDNSIPTSAEVEQDFQDQMEDLDGSNITTTRLAFFMPSRSLNFLKFLRELTSGDLVFPELRGAAPMILGVPVFKANNIPINLAGGSNGATEHYLANMTDVLVGEETDIMLAVSNEATYTDSTGTLVSAFDLDQSIWRLIDHHDMQLRHSEAVSVKTGISYGTGT